MPTADAPELTPTTPDPGVATSAAAGAAGRDPLPPGSTIGILGGGQLGRMLALAARPLGYRIAVLDPDPEGPAGGLADAFVRGGYDDLVAARRLAEASDVVTYELEHVDAYVVEAIAGLVPVRPGLAALRATQDRVAERRFLVANGSEVAPHRVVGDIGALRGAAADLGYPLRLKASIGGYDGRSQVRLASDDDLDQGYEALAGPDRPQPLLVERELGFEFELSAIAARGVDGATATFPPAMNRHDRGILFESTVPAPLTPELDAAARAIAVRIAEALDVVGLITVELFLLPGGRLAVNELAPRVHNSGHWTIEGALTSQFEQHIRAICGLPLGPTDARSPAAMVNLLGEGELRPACLEGLAGALTDPQVRVHVYDKRNVFERRKMGHVTALAATSAQALERANRARAKLSWAPAAAPPPSDHEAER